MIPNDVSCFFRFVVEPITLSIMRAATPREYLLSIITKKNIEICERAMWVHVNITFKSENIWPLVDLAYFGLIELFAKYLESVRTANWAEKELNCSVSLCWNGNLLKRRSWICRAAREARVSRALRQKLHWAPSRTPNVQASLELKSPK